MNNHLHLLREMLEREIGAYLQALPEDNLHRPVEYILALGGKRIRPVLVLLGCEAYSGELLQAIPAALAIEIFHNFTLVHDDIMDEAPLRRGQETVHTRWNHNTAILSGDVMLIEAYKQIARCPSDVMPLILDRFNQTSVDVCIGQQLDLDFETEMYVTIEQYMEMIALKTAVLLGCSLEVGSIVAKASEKESRKLYEFGKAAGIGFQLQDDYLDAFGDPDQFGKQVGGDIISNKKTFLIIKALQKGSQTERSELEKIYFKNTIADPLQKVEKVLEIFGNLDIEQETLNESKKYFHKAQSLLESLSISGDRKEGLNAFLNSLQKRKN